MSKIINRANYVDHYSFQAEEGASVKLMVGEKPSELPSLTVPGQTLPLKTLLERYTRGQHVEVFQPEYSTDPSFDGLERLDAVDRIAYAQELKAAVNVGRAKLASRNNAKASSGDEPDTNPAAQAEPL